MENTHVIIVILLLVLVWLWTKPCNHSGLSHYKAMRDGAGNVVPPPAAPAASATQAPAAPAAPAVATPAAVAERMAMRSRNSQFW